MSDIDKLFDAIRKDTECYIGKDCDLETLMARDKFIGKYSWAIPSKEIIQKLAAFIEDDIALEIGAGKALWSHLLQEAEANIIPTDICLSNKTFTDIAKYNAISAVDTFANFANTLILIWPPYGSSMAYDALNQFKGKKVIYIGEGFFGCTADDNFHHLLNKEWAMIERLHNPTWPGINDFVSLYIRQ